MATETKKERSQQKPVLVSQVVPARRKTVILGEKEQCLETARNSNVKHKGSQVHATPQYDYKVIFLINSFRVTMKERRQHQ